MRPPLAGKRAAVRRLAGEVRRRLEPVERVLPVRLPGFVGSEETPAVAPVTAGAASGLRDTESELASESAPAPASASVPAAAPAPPSAPPPEEDAAARIDAARERLRATIEPPADEYDEG